MVEVSLHRCLAEFGVDGPVVFHLDPSQGSFIQLIPRGQVLMVRFSGGNKDERIQNTDFG